MKMNENGGIAIKKSDFSTQEWWFSYQQVGVCHQEGGLCQLFATILKPSNTIKHGG